MVGITLELEYPGFPVFGDRPAKVDVERAWVKATGMMSALVLGLTAFCAPDGLLKGPPLRKLHGHLVLGGEERRPPICPSRDRRMPPCRYLNPSSGVPASALHPPSDSAGPCGRVRLCPGGRSAPRRAGAALRRGDPRQRGRE